MASDKLAARYEQDIVKVFRRHWATSAPAARRLRDLGLKDNSVIQGMLTATVLRRAGPERYFLHEPTWQARDHMSWNTVGKVGIVAAAVAILAYVLLR
jgi:hypothetical protein